MAADEQGRRGSRAGVGTPSEAAATVVAAPSTVTRKMAVTAATGAATFLITNALKQPVTTSITLSILIGGITLLVRFLVDFEQRLAVVEASSRSGQVRMERLVGDAFAKINDATRLFGSIEASAVQTDLVTQFVQHSTEISPDSPPLIYNFVRTQIRDMSDFIKEMAEGGDVTYYGEDRDWLLGLTRHVCESIDAISLASVDGGLWRSEFGQRYLDAQRQAVEENEARIRRIFIVDDRRDLAHPDMQRACRQQEEFGIQVRVLDRERTPPVLRPQVVDFIVFDGVLSYETTPASSLVNDAMPVIAETRLVLRTPRVMERVQVFRALWAAAYPIDEEERPQ
ncbi:hypothetical protein [Micromonospora sp. NBC_00617]|uniref:hypothetical protein n=1 Tax=Micromonospora sp. NBC_00617 TaxID=2903587 RepID=UPI0030DF22BB